MVPHISVYYEITLVRIRIMGGSKIHAYMAQLFVVIHTETKNVEKCYYFTFKGLTDNGAKIGPSKIHGVGETKEDAKKDAKERFKTSKHAVKITRCDSQ